MKYYLDNACIKLLQEKSEPTDELLNEIRGHELSLGWPSFLEVLHLGNVCEAFPRFDPLHAVFKMLVKAVEEGFEKEVIIALYDQLFVDWLASIQNKIAPGLLYGEIEKVDNSFFQPLLIEYKKKLEEMPKEMMHDFVLYFAWDRVLVSLAELFEYPFKGSQYIVGLQILKNCMLESFQHITRQKRTKPGFFRVVEALYALMMRDECFDSYTEEEWNLLCKSAKCLLLRDKLCDLFYIDLMIQEPGEKVPSLTVCTKNSQELVQGQIELVQFMLHKLQKDFFDWNFVLLPCQVVTV
jgi:hypothetical protein